MTWVNANSWAASLCVGGFMDWRLPTALNSDGSGPCSGFNCTGSEMGYLFYNELGGTAFSSIETTNNNNFDLFMNVQSNFHWSGLEFAPDTPFAWNFTFFDGAQLAGSKIGNLFGWAVRDGDFDALVIRVIWYY
ncbi:MAG: hypothetical protein ACE5GZ_07075 [Gammaproteobacteria bacterium]